MTLSATPYQGRADHAWPPHPEGWAEVPFHHDPDVVGRAKTLLGALPAYHYADEPLPSGLYRFFAYETPIGTAVGALKFVGAERARAMMGQGPGVTAIPLVAGQNESATGAVGSVFELTLPAGAQWASAITATGAANIGSAPSSGSNPASFTYNGGGAAIEATWVDSGGAIQTTTISIADAPPQEAPGNTAPAAPVVDVVSGRTFTPITYASLNAAAVALNNALIAHGYVVTDQPIYGGFELAAGLTVDGFPGPDTMGHLGATLAALGVAMTSATVFPWRSTTPSGATGQAAYDGQNAPTWAQWTGSGTGPAPAKPGAATASSSSSGGLLAAVLALGLTAAGVIAKTSGALG